MINHTLTDLSPVPSGTIIEVSNELGNELMAHINVSDETKARLSALKGEKTWDELMSDLISQWEKLKANDAVLTAYANYTDYDLETMSVQQGRAMPRMNEERIRRMIERIKEWNDSHEVDEQIALSASLLTDIREYYNNVTGGQIKTIKRKEYAPFTEVMKEYNEVHNYDVNHNRRHQGLSSGIRCFYSLCEQLISEEYKLAVANDISR